MTTVKELRNKIVDMAQGVSFSEITDFLALLDAYAVAARAEGAVQALKDLVNSKNAHEILDEMIEATV